MLGMEEPSDWSPLQASSDESAQGEHSLAVDTTGWTELVSFPLSDVGEVEDTLRLQVRVPASVAWGEVRVVIQLPSAGEYWTDLGGVSLVGIAPGAFTELSWPLSSNLQTKLAGSYSDLTIRVQLNAPAGEYLLDDLSFGAQGTSSPPVLELEGEPGFNTRAWLYGYIYPRSYPALDPNVVAANRREAIAQLRSQREASGYVHVGEEGVPPGSGPVEPPPDDCNQAYCDDGECLVCENSDPDDISIGGTFDVHCECVPQGSSGSGGAMGTGGSATGGSAATGGTGGTSGTGTGTTRGACGWSHAGPTNVPGRVISVSIDPVSPNVVYAGTVGGLYESTDSGRRWRRVSDAQFTQRVGTVAVWGSQVLVGPGDPDGGPWAFYHVYETTERGLWQYETGNPGTWTRLGIGTIPEDSLVNDIVFTDANTAYVATTTGVYVGNLATGTWMFSLHGLAGHEIRKLDVESTLPLILYAGEVGLDQATVWKYQAGAWASKSTGLPDDINFEYTVQVAGSGSTRYARITTVSKPANVLGPERLFKSTTAAEQLPGGGDAWTEVPGTPASSDGGAYFSVLEVEPTDAEHIYWGGIQLWESKDGGAVWTNMTCGSQPSNCSHRDYQTIHDDQHTLTFDPTDPTVLWSGNDGGLYRSSPRPANGGAWTWEFRSHGMRSSEFYSVSAGTAVAGLATGGMQDQGTQLTFGNHAWYGIDGGDGRYVAVDASNPLTILGSNQYHDLFMTLEPVPYVSLAPPVPSELRAWGNNAFWTVDGVAADATNGFIVAPPVATDPTVPRVVFAINRPLLPAPSREADLWAAPLGLIRTTDGVSWTTVLQPGGASGLPAKSRFMLSENWPPGRHVIVVSAKQNFNNRKSVYAWTVPVATRADGTEFLDVANQVIFASHQGGDSGSWNPMGPLPGTDYVMALAVDPNLSLHVFAVTNTGLLYRSVDGQTWEPAPVPISGSSPLATLPQTPMAAVVVDPANSDQLYVATDVGVLRATLQADGSASWEEFSDGLPDFSPVTDLWLNPTTRTLYVATFGYGVYRYDLDRVPTCEQSEHLLVRDNVFDQGQEPSPFGEPDPEHPVIDHSRSTLAPKFAFFKPNDDVGGRVYWWDSNDIRVATADTAIVDADNYEFESCPVEVTDCFPGTMVDSGLQRPPPGQPPQAYSVYVQATQLGLGEVPDVRAAVLVTDATVEVPPLPSTFWSDTFGVRTSAGPASCGTFDDTTGWQLVGCGSFNHPIAAAVPEVKQFSWTVSDTAPDHQCMVAVVDSFGDRVPDEIRAAGGTEQRVEDIVQQSRHIAQRNLYTINPPAGVAGPLGGGVHSPTGPYSGLTWLWVPNYATEAVEKDILLSASGMAGGRLSFLLPDGLDEVVPDLPAPCGQPPVQGGDVGVITLPRGLTEGLVALGANDRLWLGDRASIEEADAAAFAAVANAGSTGTEIGASAVVGSVTSVASVFLRSNATVTGDVTTEGTISKQNDVTVGAETTGVDLGPVTTLTWPAPAAGPFGGEVSLEPTETRTLVPGTYGKLNVKSGATLTLEGGEYRFASIEALERGAVLVANTAQQPVVIYVEGSVIVRGSIVDTAGDGSGVMVVVLGAGWATLESPFRGTLLAPYGTINLGTAGGEPHLGSFFGREVVVAADAIIRRVRFAGLDSIGACAPLTDDEAIKAVELGLDPDAVYPLGGTERHVRIPLGAGDRMKLGVRYEAGVAAADTAERFRVMSMDGATVRGGSTYVLRH